MVKIRGCFRAIMVTVMRPDTCDTSATQPPAAPSQQRSSEHNTLWWWGELWVCSFAQQVWPHIFAPLNTHAHPIWQIRQWHKKTHRRCLNKDFISKETKLRAECVAASKFSEWKTMYILLMKNKLRQGWQMRWLFFWHFKNVCSPSF